MIRYLRYEKTTMPVAWWKKFLLKEIGLEAYMVLFETGDEETRYYYPLPTEELVTEIHRRVFMMSIGEEGNDEGLNSLEWPGRLKVVRSI